MPSKSSVMDELFEQVHFLKVQLLPDGRKYTVCDHFSTERFTAEIAANNDGDANNNVINIYDSDGAVMFRLVQISSSEYKITTSFSENLGTFLINTTAQFNGNQESCTDTVPIPTHVCISESSQSIGLQADRIPLIEKTHEYHFSTADSNDVIGRINVSAARAKAVMSVQPELESEDKIRIMSSSILLLGIACSKL